MKSGFYINGNLFLSPFKPKETLFKYTIIRKQVIPLIPTSIYQSRIESLIIENAIISNNKLQKIFDFRFLKCLAIINCVVESLLFEAEGNYQPLLELAVIGTTFASPVLLNKIIRIREPRILTINKCHLELLKGLPSTYKLNLIS